MTKGKSPDTVLKGYWRDREHFADLFNAFLFGGRQVLHAQDFETEETELALLLGTGADKRKIKRHRDVANLVRYVKKYETHFAILGIENQEQIHYAMPLRTMEYDVYTYVRQYKEKYADKEEWSGESFWSGMKREDKLIPVISLVIYYGEKPWDGAKSLKQMLKIPQELKQYVNDYPMHLIEMNKDRLPFKNKDNEELFEICRRLYAESETLAEKKEKT